MAEFVEATGMQRAMWPMPGLFAVSGTLPNI
jgi:hypothetical protein